jgi:hypothetical protein
MATTPRYGFAYLDDLEPLNNTRAKLQDNAETAEAALARIDAYGTPYIVEWTHP